MDATDILQAFEDDQDARALFQKAERMSEGDWDAEAGQ